MSILTFEALHAITATVFPPPCRYPCIYMNTKTHNHKLKVCLPHAVITDPTDIHLKRWSNQNSLSTCTLQNDDCFLYEWTAWITVSVRTCCGDCGLVDRQGGEN